MTLSATAAVNRYVAAEGQLTFPFTFKLLDESHLEVFVGAEVVASGYSVSGVGSDTGGNVTFSAANVPRDIGEPSIVVTLRRSVPLDQVVDLPAQGSISSVSLEESGLDRIVMILQQLAEVDERSLKVPVDSSLADSDTEVAPVASKLIGFNATADALATYAMDSLGSGIVPTTLMENLLADATVSEALSTLGLTDLSPGSADVGRFPIVDGTGSFSFAELPLFRNLLINGDMSVQQRLDSHIATLGATGKYTLDMWQLSVGGSQAGRVTFTRDSSTLPAGHAFAMKMDCTTVESDVTSAKLVAVEQRIEANRLQHLFYGTSGAKALTLSFWFRSPKAGTHCVALQQPDSGRSYIREFSVAYADTWEQFSVSFPGDTAGMINNDNGAGLTVAFPLLAGGDAQASADQWSAGTDYATSNHQNLLDDEASDIYLTGVQLEVGPVATSFEYLPRTVMEALCYRYLWLSFPAVTGAPLALAWSEGTNTVIAQFTFPVEMRSAPSYVAESGSSIGNFDWLTVDGGSFDSPSASPTILACNRTVEVSAVKTDGFSDRQAGNLSVRGSTSQFMGFSAEL